MSNEDAGDGFYDALLDNDPHALYDRAPCGYVSTTPSGTIIQVNQTFLSLTGYSRHDLVGRRTFASLLTAGGRIYHETHYAPLLQMQGRAREVALDIVRADGERLPALVNAVVERGPGGSPTVVRAAVFDATERREYERELVRAKELAEESEARARLLARTLQQTLIPPAPPTIPGLEVAAAYRPAGSGEEVGGDFYDVFQIGENDWVVAIGDVMGKGVEAAVVTALTRYTIRAAAVRLRRPVEVLLDLNGVLLRESSDRFCTAAVAHLRRVDQQWTVTVSCAGHPLPILVTPGVEPVLVGRPGSLVGVLEQVDVSETEVALHPGTALVLYTDGVTEGRSDAGFFGEERLRASVAIHGPEAPSLVAGILGDVVEFQAHCPSDDIAIVVVACPDHAVTGRS